jgi:hypothetical protein
LTEIIVPTAGSRRHELPPARRPSFERALTPATIPAYSSVVVNVLQLIR